jgi:hypothetical protein
MGQAVYCTLVAVGLGNFHCEVFWLDRDVEVSAVGRSSLDAVSFSAA